MMGLVGSCVVSLRTRSMEMDLRDNTHVGL